MTTTICTGCVMDVSWSAAFIVVRSNWDEPIVSEYVGTIDAEDTKVAEALPARPRDFMAAVVELGDRVEWQINTSIVYPDQTVLYRGTNLCAQHLQQAVHERRNYGVRSIW